MHSFKLLSETSVAILVIFYRYKGILKIHPESVVYKIDSKFVNKEPFPVFCLSYEHLDKCLHNLSTEIRCFDIAFSILK